MNCKYCNKEVDDYYKSGIDGKVKHLFRDGYIGIFPKAKLELCPSNENLKDIKQKGGLKE